MCGARVKLTQVPKDAHASTLWDPGHLRIGGKVHCVHNFPSLRIHTPLTLLELKHRATHTDGDIRNSDRYAHEVGAY